MVLQLCGCGYNFVARANSFVVDGVPAVWLMGLDHRGSGYKIV